MKRQEWENIFCQKSEQKKEGIFPGTDVSVTFHLKGYWDSNMICFDRKWDEKLQSWNASGHEMKCSEIICLILSRYVLTSACIILKWISGCNYCPLNLGNNVVHVCGTIWIQPSQNFQVEKGVVRSILANSRICLSVAVVYPGHALGMLIWISAAPAGHVLFGKGLGL